jgi:hypothetical protein
MQYMAAFAVTRTGNVTRNAKAAVIAWSLDPPTMEDPIAGFGKQFVGKNFGTDFGGKRSRVSLTCIEK